jgi:Spy/CpxP family protein refolding chaperone
MKKLSFLAIIALAVSLHASAQEVPERTRGDYKAKHRTGDAKYMKELNLTQEQKGKFKALNEAQRNDLAALQKQDNISVKESREKRTAIMESYKTKRDAILTSEQKAMMEKKQAERKTAVKTRGEKAGARMDKELNLTPEQKTKLQESRKLNGEKVKAIRDNQSLTADQKKAELQKVKEEQQAAMKSVLTPEQYQQMEAQKDQFKKREHKRSKAPRGERPKKSATVV